MYSTERVMEMRRAIRQIIAREKFPQPQGFIGTTDGCDFASEEALGAQECVCSRLVRRKLRLPPSLHAFPTHVRFGGRVFCLW
jgi:hypothetical protein